MRAPLEVIYEEYERKEEEDPNENNPNPTHVIERYPCRFTIRNLTRIVIRRRWILA